MDNITVRTKQTKEIKININLNKLKKNVKFKRK